MTSLQAEKLKGYDGLFLLLTDLTKIKSNCRNLLSWGSVVNSTEKELLDNRVNSYGRSVDGNGESDGKLSLPGGRRCVFVFVLM